MRMVSKDFQTLPIEEDSCTWPLSMTGTIINRPAPALQLSEVPQPIKRDTHDASVMVTVEKMIPKNCGTDAVARAVDVRTQPLNACAWY